MEMKLDKLNIAQPCILSYAFQLKGHQTKMKPSYLGFCLILCFINQSICLQIHVFYTLQDINLVHDILNSNQNSTQWKLNALKLWIIQVWFDADMEITLLHIVSSGKCHVAMLSAILASNLQLWQKLICRGCSSCTTGRLLLLLWQIHLAKLTNTNTIEKDNVCNL